VFGLLDFLFLIQTNPVKVRVIHKSQHALPSYETIDSAGMDVRAMLDEPVVLKPMERALIKTGLFLEIPAGYECQVRPRSGLALKKGITVLNAPGTIDADYRGEVGVILINLSNESFTIENGERIAQLVFARFEQADFEVVDELTETDRGAGGFGSTGVK
jgi:dUTP pyrophosphatase